MFDFNKDIEEFAKGSAIFAVSIFSILIDKDIITEKEFEQYEKNATKIVENVISKLKNQAEEQFKSQYGE